MAQSADVIKELSKDKIMRRILRIILFFVLVVLVVTTILASIDSYKGRPVNFFWGLYKTNRIDTFRLIQHDTIYKTVPMSVIESNAPSKIVTSNNQKGGQTGFEINNK